MALALKFRGSAAVALAVWLLCPQTASAMAQLHTGAVTASCSMDAEIPAQTRQAAEAAALDLFRKVASGDTAGARAVLSAEARSVMPVPAFDQTVQSAHALGPFDPGSVQHAYLIAASGADPLPKMGCGDASKDADHVALSMRALPRQVHVQITTRTVGYDWSVFVWLIPENNSWKALSIDFARSSLGGLTSRDLEKVAQTQAARGHAVNAALLFKAAEGVSERGPNALFDWKTRLDQDFQRFKTPAEFNGDGPYAWALEGKTWRVDAAYLAVGPRGLMVVLDRRLGAWPGQEAADADNQAFGDALLKLHPELYDSFTAVVVNALKPDDTLGLTSTFRLS